jgi:hypothetical protein
MSFDIPLELVSLSLSSTIGKVIIVNVFKFSWVISSCHWRGKYAQWVTGGNIGPFWDDDSPDPM